MEISGSRAGPRWMLWIFLLYSKLPLIPLLGLIYLLLSDMCKLLIVCFRFVKVVKKELNVLSNPNELKILWLYYRIFERHLKKWILLNRQQQKNGILSIDLLLHLELEMQDIITQQLFLNSSKIFSKNWSMRIITHSRSGQKIVTKSWFPLLYEGIHLSIQNTLKYGLLKFHN